MDILRQYQADIMLVLSGICGVMVLFIYLTKTMRPRRKAILMLLELSAMFLLIADRKAYIYRGDTSNLGWWMVRVSNFLVFFLSLVVLCSFNLYLIDLYTHEGKLEKAPRCLIIAHFLSLIGMAMVIISQFTGLYYTFDEMNRYQRAPGFVICYVVPMIILLLQISVTLRYRQNLRLTMRLPLILFTSVCIVASIFQGFMYGISLNNIAIVLVAALLYVFVLQDMSWEVEHARKLEIDYYIEEHKKGHALFEQTTQALASAIDAKDPYTNGHSRRVAEYSMKIAQAVGKSEEECERVYFSGLLHDVGKIGVPTSIINKKGRLTSEEFEQIKQHPVLGGQILSSIKQTPWLSIGARYHHERYGGNGYPEGLKGENIPEIARIIAVADAYDAMTSNRSYRNAIPQHIVREEIVKGAGSQFDPIFANAMLHMIDVDTEYQMQEMISGASLQMTTNLRCDSIYHDCTDGVAITKEPVRISLCSQPDDGFPREECLPTLIVYDSLNAHVQPGEEDNQNVLYFEYARIRLDGHVTERNTRKVEVRVLDQESDLETTGFGEPEYGQHYSVKAVRYSDHALVLISDDRQIIQVILALPDTSRFMYISIGGEHCEVHNIRVENDKTAIGPDYIPRIAEEISFIKGRPVGDVPNLQVDGWRTHTTAGILVGDSMTLTFHTMSLPTARMIWHCPYISVFSSDDGTVNGAHFREYMLLRLDGENWESDDHVENKVQVKKGVRFEGWNVWKDEHKKGMDCVVNIERNANVISMQTENLGISIDSVTTILDDVKDVYVALTGDQCAITNIRVSKKK